MLKDDQLEVSKDKNKKKFSPSDQPSDPYENRPRGIFNKVLITPDQWKQINTLNKILWVSHIHLSVPLSTHDFINI